MIIKLIGMIYGRHSTIYRKLVDANDSSVRRISKENSLKNPKNCKELHMHLRQLKRIYHFKENLNG